MLQTCTHEGRETAGDRCGVTYICTRYGVVFERSEKRTTKGREREDVRPLTTTGVAELTMFRIKFLRAQGSSLVAAEQSPTLSVFTLFDVLGCSGYSVFYV